MKQRLNLPADLKKYVLKYILKRTILCACLFVSLLVVLILWGNTIFNTKGNVSWRVFYYGLTLSVPFLVTGVPFKLFDKTYVGTVVKVEVSSGIAVTDKSVKAVSDYWYNKNWNSKNVVYLTIVTGDGKKLYKKVYEGLSKFNDALDIYRIGNNVFHLYGTKDTVLLPTPADTHVKCAVCGGVDEKGKKFCQHCGHTLIKAAEDIYS